jgi:hypothetical protein
MGAAEMNEKSYKAIENAEEVIKLFGGIRPMASKMDVPVTTVQGWKKRNVIPANRRSEVLKAAQTNNIDLTETIELSVANENEATSVKPLYKNDEKDKKSVAANTSNVQNTEGYLGMNKEELIKELRSVEQKAVKKSVMISSSLLALVVLGVTFLLWPSQNQVVENRKNLSALQKQTANLEEKQSFLSGLLPEGFEESLGDLRQQAQSLRSTVVDLSNQVQGMASNAMEGDFSSLVSRVQTIEEKLGELEGVSPSLAALVEKVEELQGSLAGQEQLNQSLIDLRQLVTATGQEEALKETPEGVLEENLLAAQMENDALGQTLEGVPSEDLKAAALLLTLSQIRESFNRSAPFEEDLLLMQNLIGSREENPELFQAMDRLAPRSSEGVLTTEGLRNEFKGLAGEIVVASLKGEDVSVQERAKARFNEILQVEKEGELITGTDTQATVARAQKLLDQGDISGAVEELKSLQDESAANTAQSFIEEAELTVLMQNFQSQLTGSVMDKVGIKSLESYEPTQSLQSIVGGVKSTVGNVKSTVTGGKLVRDKDSGFSILVPEKKIPGAPQ